MYLKYLQPTPPSFPLPPLFRQVPDRMTTVSPHPTAARSHSRPGLLSLLGLALWLGLAQGVWAQTPTLIYAPDTQSNRRTITEDSTTAPFNPVNFNPTTGRVRVLDAATRQPVTTTFIPQTIINSYGTFTLADDGSFSFFLDNAAPETDALITGDTRRFSFAARATTISTAGRATITVFGADDPTTITGDFTRAVTETAVPITPQNAVPNTVMGRLIITDPDRDADTAIVTGDTAGAYGTFSIAADGSWTYILNNRMTATNRLRAGQRVTDPFTVQIADGTTATITINITGANDRPTSRPGDARTVAINERVMLTGMGRDPDAGDRITSYRWMQTGGPDVPLTGANTATVAFTAPQVLENTDLTFALTVADLAGVMHTNTVVITVHGPIGGDLAARVIASTTLVSFGPNLGGFVGAAGQLTPIEPIFQPQMDVRSFYGTFSLTREGGWTYDAHFTIVGLGAGEERIERFPVRADNGGTGIVTITVVGRNNVPVILGNMEGFVTEDSVLTSIGTLEVRDLDNDQNTFQEETTPGSYGSFLITEGGVWTYTLDNTNPDVQRLPGGARLTERFTVRSFDGTTATVDISISGTREPGSIRLGGTLTGTVRAGSGTLAIATGRLRVLNSDATNVVFRGPSNTITIYGTFTVSDTGFWTYTLDNNDPDTLGLAPGSATLEPLFQVQASQIQFQGFSRRGDVRICVLGPNRPPTANAGQDQFPIEGNTVMLDGTGSSDPDEKDVLAYAWTQSDGILTVNLANATTDTPTFTAPGVNTNTPLEFTLTVTDLDGATSTDTVTITVIPTPDVTVTNAALTVAENGGTDTYTMVLDTQPTGDVTITPMSNIPSAATVSAALTFTQANWNTPQPVTVTGVNDDRVNPDDRTVTVMHTIVGGTYDTVAVPDVTVTVADDDTVGLFLNPVAVNVDEGMSGTYTVALRSQPVATVTVAITAGGDVTTNPTSLTFTASDWNTPQPVTVNTGTDADGIDDTQALTHTASGGDYGAVTGTVTVTVMDSGVLGVRISTAMLEIDEGGQDTYTVRLNTQPAGNVEITVGGESGDVSVTGSPLTFTVDNWNLEQTVTVNAAEDADATADAMVTLTHAVTGYDTVSSGAEVVVTVTENDTAGVRISPTTLTIAEGDTDTYTVVLDSQPAGNVAVTVGGESGDVSVTGSPLTFTVDNWNLEQTVTVNAAEDADATADAMVTLTHAVTGYDTVSSGAEVVVTVTENDTAGVRISPTTLTVAEGGMDTYTVRLNTQPAGNVEITVGGESDDVSVTGSPLTFTVDNWNLEQTVTVNAAEDADATADAMVTLTHAVTGYDTVSSGANVVVTVTENDTAGVRISPTALTVAEGGTNTYTVVLDTQPAGNVAVTVGGESGDVRVTGSPVTLTFTMDNWNLEQTVTVNAAEDADATADAMVTLTHGVTGYDTVSSGANVVVTVTENDTAGVRISPMALTVAEGGTNTYTVVLDTQPAGNVAVTVGGESGDVSVTNSPVTLTFTTDNWNLEQTVTVNAAEDADATADAMVTLTHAVTGYDTVNSGANVVVTVTENDTAGVRISPTTLTIAEGDMDTYTVRLDTQPADTVTVTVGGASGDVSVTGSPVTLTFTMDNWNLEQTVTVNAAEDADATADAMVTLTHAVTGYDTVSSGANVVVTVTENDTAGVRISPTTLTIAEGDTDTYTVVLDSQPAGNVAVTVGGESGDVSVTGSPLTFTVDNWNLEQTVTVNAAEDADATADAMVTLTHAVTGYDTVSSGAEVVVTVTENDTAGVRISPTTLTVAEGGMDTYTVRLNTQPAGNVEITVGGESDDVSVTGSPLTFTVDNWNLEQTVTVNAAEDADATADAMVTLTHAVTGYDTVSSGANVVVTVTENDTAGVRISPTALTVAEGGTNTYTVVLDTQPAGNVAVTVGGESGDVRVTGSPVTLTFTMDNWNLEQTVTVNAAEDADATADAMVTLTHGVTGYDTVSSGANVVVTVTENDTAGVRISPMALTVAEGGTNTYTVVLDTQPAGNVAVTVGGESGDVSVTNSPVTLTFTTDNWNLEQTVTVNAAEDADATADAMVTLTHAVTGYDTVNSGANVVVTVTENDTAGVRISPTTLTIAEGDMDTYTVRLDTQPADTVTVTVGGASGDVSVTGSPVTLTFTMDNWNLEQTVTVNAAEDADATADAMVTLTHAVTGYDTVSSGAEVVVTVTENDTAGVRISPTTLTIAEGGMDTYTVRLNTQPAGNVEITVGGESGDVSVTGSPLTFTVDNWNLEQTVTVNAAEDADATADAMVTLTHGVTGYDTVSSGAEVVVTVTENDTAGVRISPTTLTIAEGDTDTYTVRLNTQPAGNVAVTVGGESGDVSVTGSLVTLTFTMDNWNLEQTVTVNAAEDADATAEALVTLTHAVTGYDTVSSGANVVVTVTENDTAGVSITPTMVTVAEGGTNTYTVRLDTQPADTVTVTVGGASGDVSVTGSPLTFTTGNWNRAQPVTVNAAEDADAIAEALVTLTHAVTGYGTVSSGAEVVVTVTENDTAGVSINPTTLTIAEGDMDTYTVVLDSQPAGNVEITVGGESGDVSVTNSPLTFTVDNWNLEQTVTVNAAEDADATADALVTLTHAVTGYDTVNSGANVVVTVTENDMAGVRISPMTLTVAEGGTDTYTVVLDTQPAGNVAVTVGGESGDVSVTNSPVTLTFTTDNWNLEQTVTVNAAEDADATADAMVTLTHAVTGYDTVNSGANVVVTVTENDTAGVRISPTTLTIAEGDMDTYTVRLDTQPADTVTVTVGGASGDVSVTGSLVTLTFTMDNWNLEQTVTVNAAEDADAVADATVTLTHAVTGYDTVSSGAEVVVTVTENDTAGVRISPTTLTIAEGDMDTYTVVLDSQPAGNVAVTVGGESGDVSVTNSPLTFTVDNWNLEQTVTVNAAEDADATADALVTLTHAVTGYDTVNSGANVVVTVTENDMAGVRISPMTLTVAEGGTDTYTVVLDTQPAGNVAVTVGGESGDVSVTNSPVTLTFTVDNWNLEQTVTVNAAEDADATADALVTLTHAVTGYDTVNSGAEVVVTVTENDTASVRISPTALTIAEGGMDTYTVVLDTQPAGNVAVTVGGESGDVSVTNSPVTLTFTMDNWNLEQTVTVNAAEDADATADAMVTLTHGVTGYDTVNSGANVVVTVTENDTAGVRISPTTLTVAEGGMDTYTVRLNTQPAGNVAITVGGESDEVSVTGSPLTFTVDNWNLEQTVTVNAAEDADATADAMVTLTHAVTGYDTVSSGANVVVTVTENDTAGVRISPTALTVAEGGTNTYTVRLNTQPAGNVAVTVGGESGDVSVTGSPLTFTVDNWNLEQTVTVNAAEDADATADAMVTLTHGVTGYDTVSSGAEVVVTVTENDTAGVRISPTTLTIAEGDMDTYTVRLDTQPADTVTVTVGGASGDVSVTGSPVTLTFTMDNWNLEQTVTVNAAEDADAVADATVTLTHAVTGYDTVSSGAEVVVTVTENDTASVRISPTALTIAEGGMDTYTVVLDTQPAGNVAVTVGGESGDVSVTNSPVTLTFTMDNWNLEQTVTVNAAEDADATADAMVTLTHAVTGYDTVSSGANVVVTVTENDTASVRISPTALTVAEGGTNTYTVVLDTQPAGNVAVTVGGESGDVSVTGSPVTLTFTMDNWNLEQTVTVNAAEDADAVADATVTLTHAVTGYDTVSSGAEVVVTVTENDTAGVRISPTTLTIAEGGMDTYTVVLDSQPAGNVEITVGGESGDVSVTNSPLTFTVDNWNLEQTVTVNAAEDADATADALVTLTHAVTGYDTVNSGANVVVTVTENDTASVRISPTALTIAEGDMDTYTVRLDTQPADTVTVTVGGASGDVSVTGSPLTFTTGNWNREQPVTVNAAEDADAAADAMVTLTHAVTGYDTVSSGAEVVVTVTENDTAGVSINPTTLTIAEGSTDTYTVRLDSQPAGNVAVTVGGESGDVSVTNSPLTFTVDNWNLEQTVTVNAAEDADATADAMVTLTHAVTGYDTVSSGANVVVTVTENDTAGVRISPTTLTVAEGGMDTYTVRLNTQPAGNVAVTVGGESGDVSVTNSPVTLTFTVDNWNLEQTVTVNAAEDADATTDIVTLTHGVTGYGDVTSGPTVVVTATDNDTPGLIFNPTAVTVNEGGTSQYTVALATQPTATVTVAITAGGDVTINPTSLTFTASDWNTPQPVTINTGTDDDGNNDTQALTHTATGGDYEGVTGTVTVTVTDNDTPSVRTSTTALTVNEGAMATYTVQLNTQPAGNVTVTVGGASDDVRVTGSPLTFTPGNWNTAQPVTITADEDADAVPDTPVTLAHTVTGYGDVTRGPTVVVTVTENDRPELIFSADSVTVHEGESGSYTVALATQPTATVTVAITAGGDVTINPTSLTFTASDWNTPQPVTINTGTDDDGNNDTQALTHTATGGDYEGVTGTVTVTVTDNDTPSVRTSTTALTVNEGAMATYTVQLNTQPAGNVTVTVGGASDDVRVTGSPLTFTPGNWNTAQPVTITADEDADAVPDTPVTLAHTVTGYGDVTRGPTVVVTVTENDRPELIFSADSVTVHEGESGSYTVALATQPTATVTVAITAGGDVTINPTSLTFTASDWNTPQPVTINTGTDDDGNNDTQALTHTATGGDYEGVTGTVTVTVTDNDTPSVRTSTTALTVNEGAMATYTVQLNTQPAGNVTVTVGGASDDVRVTGSPLTFTPGNWNTAQPVTVTADEDADAVPDTPVTLAHTVTGYGDVTRGPTVVVTVTENDRPELIFSAGSVTVHEGESGQYTVALRTQPTATVTVPITAGGDVTTNPTSLTFTTINWNAAQPVTVTAADDDDGNNDTQALTHTATGGDYEGVTGTVTVTVTDNDTPSVRTSTTALTVNEGAMATYTVQLNTQPAGNVTVTVGGASDDVRVTGSPLTFTPGNWNTAQPVTVTADEDADAVPDTPVTLAHTVTRGPTVVVTVTENDRPELIFSAGSVTVHEGESGSYTVALATQPTATVTVAITAGGDVTINPTSLTFTASDWNTPQPVTINTGTDDDGNNDTQALTHTATGGDYEGVTGTVTVTVTDNDTPSVRTSTTALTVNEGAMATYTVQLNTQPAGNVTVTVGGASDDVRVTGSPLTFTPGNWNTAQPVTITADEDADAVPDTPVTLAHTVTGYGDVTRGPTVVVTVTENDRPELIFSADSVTVNEGMSGSYTVALATQPTDTVTVAITAGGDVTINPTSLTFTTINWNAAQPVTVTAADDDDGNNDTQALTHTATGGDYEGVTGTVTVTVTDNDTPSVRTSTTALTVNEGAMATYTVQLNTQPAGNVTVTVGGASDDVRVTGSPLTFTPGNWNTAQPVTVTADEDADAVPDTPVTLAHTVTGYGDVTRGPTVVVTVTENDRPELIFSAGSVTVHEGESGQYTVALRTQPTATVTVPITAGGDVTTNPTSLTFTTINWNAAQPVTVTAADDDDGNNDTQALTHTATSGDYEGVTGTVTVTVTDNDTPGVRTSTTALTVNEGAMAIYTVQLNTQPAGNVTVTVGGASDDVRVTGSPLTFTPGNWNTAQPVTVTADEDADAVPDTPVTLAHTVTGYGDVTRGPTVVVTVTENDRPELIFSAGSVTVNEGMSGSYTVALRSQPTDTVTVPITAGGDVTTNPTSLTFTTINWNAAQPVTVTAADDDDGNNDTQALTHTATGGDYDGVTGTVTVTVMDNDTPGVRISTTMLTVVENGQNTYTVRLNTQPAGNVMVTVSGASGDVRVTGSPLTFTPDNWNTAQPITVTADEDADAVPDTPVTLAHTVTGYGDVTRGPTVVVTVTENDMPELIFSAGSVTVHEGESGQYTVALRTQPTATVTVPITAGGDVTTNPTSLTFTTINWNAAQPVTVTAADDDDGNNDTQALTHTATGGDYEGVTGTVTVTVTDNDTPSVRISTTTLTVNEGAMATYTVQLNTQPAGNVTVTVGGASDDVRVTGSPLTFTPDNWNTAQPITVTADDDADAVPDTPVTLAHTVTGYGDVTRGPTVVVTVTENDRPELIFSAGSVTVNEGMSGSYTVALATQPTATVTVAITAGGDVTINPTSLTFTASDWNTPQPVTINTSTDADGIDDTQALTHTATGGDYEAVTGTVTVTVTDNDTPGVRTSTTTLRIDEGSQDAYTVRLNTQPAGNVTITVGGTNDAVSVTGSPLTFTTINWDQMQTVTVNADQDDDATTDIVTLTHGVTGYGAITSGPTVVVTVTDDDDAGLIFNPADVTVNEGGTSQYTVALVTQPTATVTVAITAGGDVTTNPASLTFTAINWNTPQTVTVTANEDADGNTDTQALMHTAASGDYDTVTGTVTCTVTENDTPGVRTSATTLRIDEGSQATYTVRLNTKPAGNVTITVGGTNDAVSVTGSPLTFTTINWDQMQTVTVNAPQDDDATTDIVTLTHGVTGYGDVTSGPTVVVTATDNDTPGLIFNPAAVTVDEGMSGSYTVALRTQPTATVTVTITASGDVTTNLVALATQPTATMTVAITADGDITINPMSPLTFTTRDWNMPQTVTVTAAEDADSIDDTQELIHIASGGDYNGVTGANTGTVTVTVRDDGPEANAGPDQVVTVDDEVTLPRDGTGSAEGGPELTYLWTQIDGTPTVTLTNSDTPTATFIAPADPTTLVFSLMVNNDEDNVDTDTDTVTITVTNDTSRIRALKISLAAIGRTLATSTVDVIGNRFEAEEEAPPRATFSGLPCDIPRKQDNADKSGATGRTPDTRGSECKLSWQSLQTQGAFSLSLAPSAPGRLTLWGRGDFTRFQGQPRGLFSLDGELATGYLGMDYRRNDRGLVGVAISHSTGEVDYQIANSTGTLDVELASVYPYIHWTPTKGLGLWGLLGTGLGDATLMHDGLEVKTDLGMRMAAVGLRHELFGAPGSRWAFKADAFWVELEADAVDTLPVVTGEASRGRLALEHRLKLYSSPNASMTARMELGLRVDGGNAEQGMGLEAGGRLEYVSQQPGLTIEARGRTLLAHEESKWQEWGASMTIRFDPSLDGQGLAVALTPAWGQAASGVDALWAGQGATSVGATRPDRRTSWKPNQMNLELGYGMALPTRQMLTPFGKLGLTADQSRRLQAGVRLGRIGTPQLELIGEQNNTRNNQPPEYRIGMTWSIPF